MSRIIRQHLNVRFEYPVVFTRGLFAEGNPVLHEVLGAAVDAHPAPSALLFIEEAVAAAHPRLVAQIPAAFRHHFPTLTLHGPVVVRGGEPVKSDASALRMMLDRMTQAQLDRHALVFAVGGGALLDAVGYAASLVHRGLRMVRVPTTVLAQDDGGVGVKTAINDPAGKNFLGTFAPPFAVLNDFDFLRSLGDDDWRAGMAEAFKVAMIKDAGFFDWLCGYAAALAIRDEAAMEELVYRCAALHLQHIRENGDPFEMGTARPLDYGHWSAHQLERLTGYQLGHGAAVAIGIALDALYAVRIDLLRPDEAERLLAGLEAVGFRLWHDALEDPDPLLEGLARFREHLGGRLCITLPRGIGFSMEVGTMDEALVRESLAALASRCRSVGA